MSYPSFPSSRRGKQLAPIIIACSCALMVAYRSEAQQPTVGSPLPSYHPPMLALAQPANGGSIPQDRPVVVFRFAPGDSTDPVDARSFTITVDGKDRSAAFQAARDMVWGALASADQASELRLGAHTIVARICSIRGTCADVSATVMVTGATLGDPNAPAPNRKRTVLDLVLAALRKLLVP